MQVAAGENRTALLMSDGPVGARGHPGDDLTCVKIAVGGRRSALPRSDGAAVACCRLAALAEDLTYVKVAAGGRHTALHRNDGAAVALCRLAALVEDLTSSPALSGTQRQPELLERTPLTAAWSSARSFRSGSAQLRAAKRQKASTLLP